MKKLFLLAIIIFSALSAFAQTHEYAPLKEAEFKYKDWTYKNVQTGADVNLRTAIKGKKLVMVVYFAAWCPQWRNQAPFTEKLYQKYKANGFEVIGVGEYDLADNVKTSMTRFDITFPVVIESELRTDREKTPHAEYRKGSGDTRNWGSPWNIFIEPSLVKKEGETLLTKASVVTGELIEAEVEAFIRQKLGLPAEKAATAQTKEFEPCSDGPVTGLALKKP